MKKLHLLAAMLVTLFSVTNPVQKHTSDCELFHANLLTEQLKKMITYDRAPELKLWLDQASYGPQKAIILLTLHQLAVNHNSTQSIQVLQNLIQSSTSL